MKLTRPPLLVAVPTVALLGAATAGVVARAGTPKTIKVTEKEFRITLSSHEATAGRVRFVVRNTGKYPHALAISGAGVKVTKTPLIKPGKSAVLVVTLRSGRYSLWCPIPGHAAKGMKTALTLPGRTTGPPTPATSTTSTTTDPGTTTTEPIPGY
jgi:Sulfocyanin (SoxE) domain